VIDNKLYFFTDVELSKLELTGHAYDCYMHDVQLHSYIYFLVRAPIINQLHGHLIPFFFSVDIRVNLYVF